MNQLTWFAEREEVAQWRGVQLETLITDWIQQGEVGLEHVPLDECLCSWWQYVECSPHFCRCFSCNIYKDYPCFMLPWFFFRGLEVPLAQYFWDLFDQHVSDRLAAVLPKLRARLQVLNFLCCPGQATRVIVMRQSRPWFVRAGLSRQKANQLMRLLYQRMGQEKHFMEELISLIKELQTVIRGKNPLTPPEANLQFGKLGRLLDRHIQEFCEMFPNRLPDRAFLLLTEHQFQLEYNRDLQSPPHRRMAVVQQFISNGLHQFIQWQRTQPQP